MGLADGKIDDKYLYATSDISLSAYLIMRGFELLGAVDRGKIGFGDRRLKEFVLTHTDPYVLDNLEVEIAKRAAEYREHFSIAPGDKEALLNFWEFYGHIKKLHRAMDEAIKR